MSMANQETAKTKMKVCIFVAIVVPDMAALRMTDEQRVRRYGLKRAGNTCWHGFFCTFVNLVRTRCAPAKLCLLAHDDFFYKPGIDCNGFPKHKGGPFPGKLFRADK